MARQSISPVSPTLIRAGYNNLPVVYRDKSLRAMEAEIDRASAQKAQFSNMAANYTAKAKAEYAAKQAAKPKVSNAVARRVGVQSSRPGVTAAAVGAKAPPPDPLEVLRGEYDKYLTGVYGGLTTSLEDIRNQYKTRSDELAARLGANYDEAANVAGATTTRAQTGMEEFAKRLGIQSATQGQNTQDWMQTNERLKSLNAVNRASSLSTNDFIRSNYYDFLTDKISGARGLEAQSRAGINDIFAQAQLQRQQAAAAAAYAARSARRGGGGGGGGSSSGTPKLTTEQKTTVSSEEFSRLFQEGTPAQRAALMSLDANTKTLANSGVTPPSMGYVGNLSAAEYKKRSTPDPSKLTPKQAQDLALAYYLATGKSGGAKTTTTTTAKRTG